MTPLLLSPAKAPPLYDSTNRYFVTVTISYYHGYYVLTVYTIITLRFIINVFVIDYRYQEIVFSSERDSAAQDHDRKVMMFN